MSKINITQKSAEILEAITNPRIKDIISRRFGLNGQPVETLEAIGQDHKYGITRERVRQIEENGLKILTQPKLMSAMRPVFLLLQDYLLEHGGLRREEKIFADLVDCGSPRGVAGDSGSILLFLNLSPHFVRIGQTEKFHPIWLINKNSFKKAVKVIEYLTDYFNANNNLANQAELLKLAKKKDINLNEKTLTSFIDASKYLTSNHFGEFGLAHWPQINPKGVRDKAFMIFKKEKRPLHFTEVTNLINQESFDAKRAHIQTVHNELIKDGRFILVGRGIYALNEWGYEPGTVIEVISGLLKSRGPLTKEQIVAQVMEKRMIKENTILINLQNRKLFKRTEEGKYLLA